MKYCNLYFTSVLFIFCHFTTGENVYSVRFNEGGIQIYADDDGDRGWFYIRDNKFEYPEGAIICNNLTGNSLANYYTFNSDSTKMAKLDCAVTDSSLSQCGDIKFKTKKDRVNISCLSSDGMSEGDIRQLQDGRILYLVRPNNSPFLVWAHFCYKDNSWDTNISNLLCKGLGYHGVKEGGVQVQFSEKVFGFGLDDFACASQVTSYRNCTFSQRTGDGECRSDKVIKIECESLISTNTGMVPNETALLDIIQMPTVNNQNTTPLNYTKASTPSGITGGPEVLDDGMSNTQHNTVQNNTTKNMISTTLAPNTKNNQVTKGVLAFLVFMFVLLGIIVGIVILVRIIITRRRSKRKCIVYKNNSTSNELRISMLDNVDYPINNSPYTEIDLGEQISIRRPSNYLDSMILSSFDESSQDENIYEGVLNRHSQFVQSSEERHYYAISSLKKPSFVQKQSEMLSATSLCEDEYWEPGATIECIYAQMSQFRYKEIERCELVEDYKLGEGNFGKVMGGSWNTNGETIHVAIKTLKVENEESNINFLQEAAILGQFHHTNVLKLLGVVTLTKPLLMVTEQMRTGLKAFLNTIRQSGNPNFDLFGIMFLKLTNDIANGMQHLASKKFVHRDLAARNILLSHSLTCKISDFGLARHAIENDEYYTSSGGKIPLKWTAPEAIFYKKYSEKSDVWSYGVTIYEVWSLGTAPWIGVKPDELIENISQGVILPPPSGCPRRVYELMVDCWNPDNHDRPTFKQIVATLESEEGTFLNRGKDPMERMEFGLPPSSSEHLFKDLQNKYNN